MRISLLKTIQKHISITDCSKNDTISKCMEDFLDEKFENCNTEMFNNYSCPLYDLFERSFMAQGLRMSGYQQVVDVTGCKLPCTRYGYELNTGIEYNKLVISQAMKKVTNQKIIKLTQ